MTTTIFPIACKPDQKYSKTIKYTTTNKDDAIKWSQNKIIEGYAVTVNYDEETGEYTCIATR